MPSLTADQIRHFVRELVNQPDAEALLWATRAEAALAAWCGVPRRAAGQPITFSQVSYTHRTHRGEALCYVRAFGELELPVGPIVSVTSVTDSGTALVEDTDYELDGLSRCLYRLGYPQNGWTPDFGAIKVVYLAGYADLETEAPTLYEILGEYAKHLFDRQGRQGQQSAGMGGASASYREETIPEHLRASLDAGGYLLPRGRRRLEAAKQAAGVPQVTPPSSGGGAR